MELETKYCAGTTEMTLTAGHVIEGYASLFGAADQSGDIVEPGAYGRWLGNLTSRGGRVAMLWQHDAGTPIGVWDEVREDDRGLYVRGRLVLETRRGADAAALVAAGAIDGLSIGYRTRKAGRDGQGRRLLQDVELWEVSLVTFPMLFEARVGSKGREAPEAPWRELAAALRTASRELADG